MIFLSRSHPLLMGDILSEKLERKYARHCNKKLLKRTVGARKAEELLAKYKKI